MAFDRRTMTFDELEEAKEAMINTYLKQAEQRDEALDRRDAALALLRRLVVSIRLGSIDEAAVREAGRLVGEDGGG